MQYDLKEEFRKQFQKEPEHIFFCPGRVNLIGEHIDYNGGNVMPCAISPGTYLAVASNSEKLLRFRCLNFPETANIPLGSSYKKMGKEWFNYPLGVFDYFTRYEGRSSSGLDLVYYGNLPIGAGLSSSASIEVVTAFALNTICQFNDTNVSLALLSQKIENEFIGVNCGIMDQFAVAMGKKDKAILLDCDTLDYEYLPFCTDEYALMILNSNKQRSLSESKYNERFSECERALGLLQKELNKTHLCDIDLPTFNKYRHLINDPLLEKRALHVISENARVQEAKKALTNEDLLSFGKAMYASHESLKDLYEVSGKELDTLVSLCKTYDGCIGARMTGAGFGGCAIALVKKELVDDFSSKLSTYYQKVIGYEPGLFPTEIGDGVRTLVENKSLIV